MGLRQSRPEPERRCIVTGKRSSTAPLIRVVLGPDGLIAPDLEQKLPGRGAWICADPEAFRQAERRNPFVRAFGEGARLPEDLSGLVTGLLTRRCMNLLGLANGAGQATAGYEKVREMAMRGPVGAMIVAADAGDTARQRARKLAGEAPIVALFGREQLSLALGRENVVNAALAPGRLAGNFARDAERLRLLKGSLDTDAVTNTDIR